MSALNDTFEKFAEIQKESLGPMRKFSGLAVDAFEQFARKNYALAGDMLDFTIRQAKLTVEVREPRDMFERQVASTKEFADLIGKRANEYVELSSSFQDSARDLFEKEAVDPAQKAAKAAAKKAA